MNRSRCVLVSLLCLGCAGAVGCSSPADNQNAANIERDFEMLVVSGDGQSGRVATELPSPVVVQVMKNKKPVVGQIVNFVVTTASDPLNATKGVDAGAPSVVDAVFKGRVFAGVATTDSTGRAQDFWMLGARTSYPQKLEARAADPTSGKQVFATFTATALPGPAATITNWRYMPIGSGMDAGAGQPDGGAGASLVETVTVYDVMGNPVNDVPITFTVTTGGGTVTPSTVKTAADGTAQATWSMGTTPNINNTLVATAAGVANSVSWSNYVGCSVGSACSWGSGVCVDVQQDPNNCGWCGRQCGNAACVNGSCVCSGTDGGGGMSLCWSKVGNGQTCVDLQSDNGNCGWCGNECPSGTNCVSGSCQCQGSGVDGGGTLNLCWSADGGQSCVDLQSDNYNCGSCGHRCENGAACVAGGCQCSETTYMCWGPSGSVCTDLQNDSSNCGYCGNQCPASTTCVAGVCQCSGGGSACQTTSGLVCVDLKTDPKNCGYCGSICGDGTSHVCREGSCLWCPPDTIYCKGLNTCTNPNNDPQNCGGCGITCKSGAACAAGQCTCQGRTDCGSYCADLFYPYYWGSDPENCGACGYSCPPGSRMCSEGVCSSCGTLGETYGECDNKCTDLFTDVNNCGGCGATDPTRVCGLNSSCVRGICISGQ